MLALVFVVALLAFSISAIAGGGASLLLVPLLGQVLSVASIPAALSVGTGASSVSRLATFHRHVRWDIAARFVPAAVPMALAGALLLRFVNPAYMQLLMALFLIAQVPRLIRPAAKPAGPKPSTWAIAGVGAVAGFLSGLTGAVGVMFNGFYLRHGMTKEEIIATRAANEVLVHLAKLVVYAKLGLLDPSALKAGLVLAAAATVASVALQPLLARLPYVAFARIGYAAMALSGFALLTESVSRVTKEDRIAFNYHPLVSGVDATLQWRDSSFSIELEYNEGIELELSTELSALTADQQRLVRAQDPGETKVLLEVVYAVGRRYYEAYYLHSGRVVKKVEFDADGQLLAGDE